MFFSEGSHSSKPNFFSWKFCTVSRSFKIATKFMLYPQGKLLFYLCLYLTKNRKKKSLPIHTSGNHPYWWRNIFIFIIFEGKKKKIGLEFQKRATSKINIPFTIYIYIKKKYDRNSESFTLRTSQETEDLKIIKRSLFYSFLKRSSLSRPTSIVDPGIATSLMKLLNFSEFFYLTVIFLPLCVDLVWTWARLRTAYNFSFSFPECVLVASRPRF